MRAKKKRMFFTRREEEQTVGGGVTDTWDAKRKRMLFGRREEEQTQWEVDMTDKCYSVGQRADMIILKGSAHRVRRVNHQSDSQSLTENFFFLDLNVYTLPTKQKYKRLKYSVSVSVTHRKPISKRF